MLTPDELQRVELEGHLAEILADSSRVLQARHYWNKNHASSTPLPIDRFWNRGATAKRLLLKSALGESIEADDIRYVQDILVEVREENGRGDGED